MIDIEKYDKLGKLDESKYDWGKFYSDRNKLNQCRSY